MTEKSTERSGNINKVNKQNIPELRFPGFNGVWEVKSLNEVCHFLRGKTYDKKDLSENGLILLQAKNLQNNKILIDEIENEYVDFECKNKILLEENDILICRINGSEELVGKTAVYTGQYKNKVTVGDFALILRDTPPLLKWLFQTDTYKWNLNRINTGTNIFNIKAEDVKKICFFYPSKKEQMKISDFLSIIDQKIELMEKKYKHYIQFKKYLLQNLFNEKYQNKNFERLIDKTEIKKLGELSKIQTGNKDLKDKKDDGQYPFFVRSEKIERIDTYSFEGEAILIPGDGKIGEIYHYINSKFDYHQRVYKISNFENVIGKYVYYYLQENFLKEAKRNTAKATVDSLRLSTITDMKIKLPSIQVQNIIVDLLSSSDDIIFSLKQEIELNKEFKRALLSKMFC